MEPGSAAKLKLQILSEFQITYWIDCFHIACKWCPITVPNLDSVPVVKVWILKQILLISLKGTAQEHGGDTSWKNITRSITIVTPGLNFWYRLKRPEKAMSLAISLDEPKRVFLRARQVVTLLHHAPPYEPEQKTGWLQKK